MPPIIAKNLRTIHEALARAIGDLAGQGVVASAFASQIATLDLIQQRTDALRGSHIYFHTGAGIQQDRVITAFTPYSIAGQTAITQILRPWSPVPSTNTEFFIHKLFSGTQYNDAIIQAVRRVQRRQLTSKFDDSMVVNSLLRNSKFEIWSGGTSSAPDNWTLNGTGATIARNGTIVWPNTLYSAALTNQAAQEAYLSQQVGDYGRFKGLRFNLRASVHAQTADRVRLRVVDGTNTRNSSYHNGQGFQELTILDTALPDAITDFTVQLRIEAGGAMTAYWLKLVLEAGDMVYEYPLNTWPTGFVFINQVAIEGQIAGVFNDVVPDEWWYIDRATKRLVFRKNFFTPITGKVVEVQGQAYPLEPSAETDAVEADNTYVIARAGSTLLQSLPFGEASQNFRARYVAWRDEADRLESQMHTRPYPNAKVVEEL